MAIIKVLNGKVSSSTDFDLTVGTTDVMTLESGGNVGIGTTNPLYELDIYNTVPIINLRNNSAVADGSQAGTLQTYSGSTYLGAIQFRPELASNGASISFRQRVSGTNTNVVTINNGDVGIGITNPAAELSISDGTDTFDFDVSTNALKILTTTSDGSDDQRILINAGADGESSTRGAYISLNGNEYTSNPGKAILQSGNFGGAGILFRGAGGVDMMFMSSSGDFGVGTITPADKVHIADSSATDFRALTLRNSSGTTDSAVVLGFEASAGTLGDDAALAAQIKGVRLGSGTNGALSF
jgi:hypothetical protein